LFAALLSVGAGTYLIYALFIKLRTPCRLCLLGHGVNILIGLLLVFAKAKF
jgi:hypothetical protein